MAVVMSVVDIDLAVVVIVVDVDVGGDAVDD